jgi:hypothetical protein
MTFDEMTKAIEEAERTLRIADSQVYKMASLLVGRLHKVDTMWVLSSLKRELRDYNMQSGTWKER